MILELLKNLIIVIVGLIFVSSIAIIFFRWKNVNYTERKQIFKNAEYVSVWIILVCLVTTMLYGVFNHYELQKSVSAVISLNFPEASQALNSNGTRYNMAEIISDEVIERAIQKGALEDVTVKQLKNCLSVYPCIQGGVDDEAQ